jgi:predicted dehydrogenase
VTALRLGVIGLSEGNGHPYSWSAIFNGYEPAAMEGCGFPVIPRYLEKQRFPEDAIAGAKVTHVWAQDRKTAAHIASAARIDHVVDRYTDMIGLVDGVLLARDDAEAHYEFAAPFLHAGLPVYVDKPLALSRAEANRLLALERYPGQLFSCSAMRYAKEFQLSAAERQELGRVRQVHATAPKDWAKYAVHAIEPLLLVARDRGDLQRYRAWRSGDSTTLAAEFASGLCALVSTVGSCPAPIALRVMGERGWKDLYFRDTYHAFKTALQEFVRGIAEKDVRIEPAFMLEVASLIEAGMDA